MSAITPVSDGMGHGSTHESACYAKQSNSDREIRANAASFKQKSFFVVLHNAFDGQLN